MNQILEGLEGVLCQMDDVLIFGSNKAQHDARLTAVLKGLEKQPESHSIHRNVNLQRAE